VYNPPEYVPAVEQNEIFTWVETIFTQFILAANPDEYIIVGGDFN